MADYSINKDLLSSDEQDILRKFDVQLPARRYQGPANRSQQCQPEPLPILLTGLRGGTIFCTLSCTFN